MTRSLVTDMYPSPPKESVEPHPECGRITMHQMMSLLEGEALGLILQAVLRSMNDEAMHDKCNSDLRFPNSLLYFICDSFPRVLTRSP